MTEAGDISSYSFTCMTLLQRVHSAGLRFARLDKAQRFRDRHLEDNYFIFGQRRFGMP